MSGKRIAENLELIGSEEDAGSRLDVFLADRIGQTRSQVKRLLADGLIAVNGTAVKAGYRLKPGDRISVSIPEPEPLELEPENLELEVIYQDQDLAVVNKPPGLVVHPGAGNTRHTLVNALLYHITDLSRIGGKLRPGIVHRLDKDTSGLMVIAKNDFVHQNLAAQLKARTVKRHYLALVHGIIKDDKGRIEAPIGRHPVDRKKMAVSEQGRPAVTEFEVLEQVNSKYSLVECRLVTGRTHQIRVHLAAINHPIVGDPEYGRKQGNLGAQRQLLHAYYLGFKHPRGEWVEYKTKLPRDFEQILIKARLS